MKTIKFFGFIVTCFCLSMSVNAQVSIGSPLPDDSAQLDVTATDRGVLVPRVAIQSTTDTATINGGAPAVSLLIYATDTVGDVYPGFYYWYNGAWMRVVNADDVTLLETVTTLVDNADGTMTYTDEDDVVNVITTSAGSGYVLITDGTIDIDGDGTPDNNVSLQDFIDNIGNIVSAHETVTTLVDNTDGTMTYTDEDGTANTITTSAGSNNVLVDDGTIDIDGDMVLDNNVTLQDVINNINNIVAANETLTTFALNADGYTLEYTDEDGVLSTVNLATVIDNFETVSSITIDETLGTITFTDEDGADTTLDVGALVAAHETLTTLVDNADGTMTYTDEDGTAILLSRNFVLIIYFKLFWR